MSSRQKQPALGWRHVVDENLLAESVHLEKSGQFLLLSLLPQVCVRSSHSFGVAAWLLQLRGEQSNEE
jgi:hypothetical protein